jgi:hypothetical protein
MAGNKSKTRLPDPSDEEIESEPEPRPKKPAGKPKNRNVTRQGNGRPLLSTPHSSPHSGSVDEDSPERPMRADDGDEHRPQTRERGAQSRPLFFYSFYSNYLNTAAPRKAKENALISRSKVSTLPATAQLTVSTDWVETGRHKTQTDATKAQEQPAKVDPPKDGRAKAKGSKGPKKGAQCKQFLMSSSH